MLAEKGMDLNMQNNDNDTALILAAKNGIKDNIRIVQKMLELKADPFLENKNGESFYSIVSQEALINKYIYDESVLYIFLITE
jgi:ankyrin repeat protein